MLYKYNVYRKQTSIGLVQNSNAFAPFSGLLLGSLDQLTGVMDAFLPPVNTVLPVYMKRFGTAKTVPYIQKNHVREVHLYIYILGSIARET